MYRHLINKTKAARLDSISSSRQSVGNRNHSVACKNSNKQYEDGNTLLRFHFNELMAEETGAGSSKMISERKRSKWPEYFGDKLSVPTTGMASSSFSPAPQKRNSSQFGERSPSAGVIENKARQAMNNTTTDMKDTMAKTMHQLPRIGRTANSSMPKLQNKMNRSQMSQGRNSLRDNSFNDYIPAAAINLDQVRLTATTMTGFNFRAKEPKQANRPRFEGSMNSKSVLQNKTRHKPEAQASLNNRSRMISPQIVAEAKQSNRSFSTASSQLPLKSNKMANKSLLTLNSKLQSQKHVQSIQSQPNLKQSLQNSPTTTQQKPNLDLVLVQNAPSIQKKKMKRPTFLSQEGLSTIESSPSKFLQKNARQSLKTRATEPDLATAKLYQTFHQPRLSNQQQLDVNVTELPRMSSKMESMLDEIPKIMLGQHSLEPELLSTGSKDYSTHVFDPQAMQKLFNNEEREKMTNVIDSLDLEETIRLKARLYFGNEQQRLKREAAILKHHQMEGSVQRSGQLSFTTSNQPNNQINAILASKETDLDNPILNNIYSQRQVATQHEIKRKLHHMINHIDIERNNMKKDQLQTQEFVPPQQSDAMSRLSSSLGKMTSHGRIQSNNEEIKAPQWYLGSSQNSIGNSKQSKVTKKALLKRRKSDVRGVVHGDLDNEIQNGQMQKLLNSLSQNLPDEFDEEHKGLQELSHELSNRKKEKMTQQAYSKRRGQQRQKMTGIKRDYCEKVLGQYRFGLHQKAPLSTNPDAPAAHRFSQLAEYRFASNNKRFMELFEDQVEELRQTRRFLADQISKSPEGRIKASEIHAASPLMNKLQQSMHQKLVDQTIQQQIDTVKKTKVQYQVNKLIELLAFEQKELETIDQTIQDHINSAMATYPQDSQISRLIESQKEKQNSIKLIERAIIEQTEIMMKADQELQRGGLLELQQRKKNDKPMRTSYDSASSEASNKPSSASSMQRFNLIKKNEFDHLLVTDAIGFIDVQTEIKLEQGMQNILKGVPLIDINRDFVQSANENQKRRLQVATYEMDQLITDQYYGADQEKMGLSLCFDQQEVDQKQNFKKQEKEVANYLKILFGGDTRSKEFQDMSKNLINKLSRQKTDDSMTRERAIEIEQEEVAEINIDQEDVNTEIIAMLADEILRKDEFYKLLKTNVRGVNDLVQDSHKSRLIEKQQKMTNEELKDQKGALFHRVETQRNAQGSQKSQGVRDRRLSSDVINAQMAKQKQNYLRKIANDDEPHDTDMQNIEDVNIEQAKSKFIEMCTKNLVVTLPLLLKVKDKQVILQRYQLNNGLCHALGLAFTQFPDIATRFYFEANNLADEDFAVLLDGMNELTIVNSLTYKHNQFGKKSLDALMPIISREQSSLALRNLHLIHCKITPQVTNELLCSLNQQKNRIRNLSLVNVNLNQSNYMALCQLIKVSRSLQELDISWNEMRCQQMYELIDVIGENRSLQYLNLSYNNLYNPLQAKFAESTPFQMMQKMIKQKDIEMKTKKAKTLAQKAAAEYDGMDISMQHIVKLCKFIKMNSKLMHLNLSGMGMTQPMMNQFGRALRRTKSMVSLHLSGNNGNNEELRTALFERAHMKPFDPIVRPDLRQLQMKDNMKDADRKEFRLEDTIKIGNTDEAGRFTKSNTKISEQLNLKNMLKNKRGQINLQVMEENASEMLIFSRYLGHKLEMPGSGQWRMIATQNDEQERCWVCNQEVYTLVFWSREFGFKTQQELENSGLDELACENQMYDLERQNRERGITVDYFADAGNPQLYQNAHQLAGFPLIYGDFNNWKPQRMYTIEELCYILDSPKPDIIGTLKKGNFIKPTVKTVDDMNPKERVLYEERVKTLFTKYSRMKNWRKLLGTQLTHKRPFLANAEALLLSNSSVKISKIDESLYPSDSESDFGSGSEEDSMNSDQESQCDGSSQSSVQATNMSSQPLPKTSTYSSPMKQSTMTKASVVSKIRNQLHKQLYVMPCFLNPGKTTFIVQAQVSQADVSTHSQKLSSVKRKTGTQFNGNAESTLKRSHSMENKESDGKNSKEALVSVDELDSQFFFHNVQAPMRREPVPLFVKKLAKKENEKDTFDKSNTVFKDWIAIKDSDLDKMIEHDTKFWNIPRFVKDPAVVSIRPKPPNNSVFVFIQQLKEVYNVLRKYLRKLFYIMITVASQSNFPAITWLDFSKFTELCQISDNKNIQQKDVDRFFLASLGGSKDGKYRYQFLEAVMRVADCKFYQSGIAKNQAEALEMLIEDHFLKYGPVTEWQDFRDDIWHKYEHHRILHANLSALKKVYNSFFQPRKKFMNKMDCLELMTKITRIINEETKVIYCFGMSKMAVVSDTGDRAKYDELKFVEFLEFIGRCADIKYRDEEDMNMEDKLKQFLDEMFPHYGSQRIEVTDEEEELSESDPDY